MAYVISDNSFSRDSKNIRATRLDLISANIDDHAAELELETSLLTWAQGAGAAYLAALIKQTNKQGEFQEAFSNLRAKEKQMLKRYVQLKELILSRFEEKTILWQYGVISRTPITRQGRVAAATDLVKENAQRLAEGDPRALPATMTDSLSELATEVKELEDEAYERKEIALNTSAELAALYSADSDKLRVLLNWCRSYWGGDDPRMIVLGFVQTKKRRGGRSPVAPEGLAFDAETNSFEWEASEKATSYQLVYRAAGGKNDWEAAYSGSATSAVFDPGSGVWEFKVRARNAHGFGGFSEPIEIDTREERE